MPHITVPLHSLVLCETSATANFADHEVIGLAAIGRQLISPARRRDFATTIYGELRHRVALKLSLGERVVVDTDGLSSDSIQQLTSIASNQGAAVFTHLLASDDVQPVSVLPTQIEPYLRQHWDGISVIADVHGNLDALERAMAWARSRRHFVWLLGDVLDYGKQTLETTSLAYHAVMHGEAAFMLANHEQKIIRWLNQNGDTVRLSDGNKVTTSALHRLSANARDQWAGQFRALMAHSMLTQTVGNITFVHAATHPSLWSDEPDAHAVEQFALYGEADHSSGRYRRIHTWVNDVPAGQMVIVGHDILSKYPLLLRGEDGGSVVFLDTGCGKGGHLSSADLRFTADGLHLECFTRH